MRAHATVIRGWWLGYKAWGLGGLCVFSTQSSFCQRDVIHSGSIGGHMLTTAIVLTAFMAVFAVLYGVALAVAWVLGIEIVDD